MLPFQANFVYYFASVTTDVLHIQYFTVPLCSIVDACTVLHTFDSLALSVDVFAFICR